MLLVSPIAIHLDLSQVRSFDLATIWRKQVVQDVNKEKS